MKRLKNKKIIIMCILVGILIVVMACNKTTTSKDVTADTNEMTDEMAEETVDEESIEENVTVEPVIDEEDDDTKEPNQSTEYTYNDFTKIMYTTKEVNVRKAPNINGEKVGFLYGGQKVEVTGQCNETKWYRVRYEGTDAYVSNDYLTEEISVNKSESSWVEKLDVAQNTTQIVVVAAKGTSATVSMHTKDENNVWHEIISTPGRIGKNGLGKAKEGDGKTPVGVFKFNKAFGVLSNPGISSMPYLQVDETHHWVDDPNSKYYNKCVSTRDVEVDWKSSEHLLEERPLYNYVLSINYNEECNPTAGSAIFLHCASKSFGYTSGCISIAEQQMIQIMKNLQSDCIIIIDNTTNVHNY